MINSIRGRSLFEIVVVLICIMILMVVAIKILRYLQVKAEETHLKVTLSNLQTALNLQLAYKITHGFRSNEKFDCINPMDYLAVTPQNYLGLLSDRDAEEIPLNSWYFDQGSCMLVYILRYDDYFQTVLPGKPTRARFRVKVVYTQYNNEKILNRPQNQSIVGLVLEPLEQYQWLEEEN